MTERRKAKTFDEVRAELRERTLEEQKQLNKIAIAQLKTWLADDSGYDELKGGQVSTAHCCPGLGSIGSCSRRNTLVPTAF